VEAAQLSLLPTFDSGGRDQVFLETDPNKMTWGGVLDIVEEKKKKNWVPPIHLLR
jgi:hypothetical protein